jgi:hypothetical protein
VPTHFRPSPRNKGPLNRKQEAKQARPNVDDIDSDRLLLSCGEARPHSGSRATLVPGRARERPANSIPFFHVEFGEDNKGRVAGVFRDALDEEHGLTGKPASLGRRDDTVLSNE